MVSSTENTLIQNIKLSSIGPSNVTGTDVTHEPNAMDLAMKLHYIFGVYIFRSHAVLGLSVMNIKESMFFWLNEYYVTCGRFRRSESGRPYLKCNDCGARFVEAQCDNSVDEWLEMRDCSLDKLLVSHQPIGPELSFSPPLYIQITWFKCGGMSLGLSCSHILGDVFSVCDFMNKWSPFMTTSNASTLPNLTKSPSPKSQTSTPLPNPKNPLSIKRVDPVGDHWVTPSNCKMDSFSFHLTPTQISHLQSKISGKIPIFETLCAIIWQCVAQIRDGSGPNKVTICKKDPHNWKNNAKLSNSQIISCVEANIQIKDANLEQLAAILVNEGVDERGEIEEAMERENGVGDFIVYGANLTFVNMEEADVYGLELKAEFVSFGIQGVGDEGSVVVMPEAKDLDKDVGKLGRFVTITLPEDEIVKLKPEFKKNDLLLETNLE
ncbi:protein ECERIFERUM 26-like [Pistacia vera]|uniref:protein ECERIFERUM 26-like n=1 Tax=Pistacia vera TaxID=55513 RepID=UPI001262F633|nr:protein ECERIFERUM 26-like [Pistacia vera]